MVLATHYLHEKDVVHRDLKAENIVFAAKARPRAPRARAPPPRPRRPGARRPPRCGAPAAAAAATTMVS